MFRGPRSCSGRPAVVFRGPAVAFRGRGRVPGGPRSCSGGPRSCSGAARCHVPGAAVVFRAARGRVPGRPAVMFRGRGRVPGGPRSCSGAAVVFRGARGRVPGRPAVMFRGRGRVPGGPRSCSGAAVVFRGARGRVPGARGRVPGAPAAAFPCRALSSEVWGRYRAPKLPTIKLARLRPLSRQPRIRAKRLGIMPRGASSRALGPGSRVWCERATARTSHGKRAMVRGGTRRGWNSPAQA